MNCDHFHRGADKMLFNFSYRNMFDNIELNLYTCGYDACKSSHAYGPAVRSGYLIHLVLEGKGTYKVNNQSHDLTAGDAFIIYPNELIYYEADKETPWKYIWIGFVGTKVEDYLNQTTLSKEQPVFKLGAKSQLVPAIHQVIEATKVESNKNLKILSSLYDFFYVLLQEYPQQKQAKKIPHQTYVEEALAYIQSNYQDDISVKDIADYLSIDRSYLHRIFKKYTKMSTQEYILNLKMEKASSLLSTTNLKIGDIARSVGYHDPLLFSKTFKKIKQYTPSDYRQQFNENN